MSFHGDPYPALAQLLYHREQQTQQHTRDLLHLYGSQPQNREHNRHLLHLYGSHPQNTEHAMALAAAAARDSIYGSQVFPPTPASTSSSAFFSSRGSQVLPPPALSLSAYPSSDWGTTPRPYDLEPSLLGAHPFSVAAAGAGGRQRSYSNACDDLVFPATGEVGPPHPSSYSADRGSMHHPSIHRLIQETRKLHALWRSGVAKRSREGGNVYHKNKRAKFEKNEQAAYAKQTFGVAEEKQCRKQERVPKLSKGPVEEVKQSDTWKQRKKMSDEAKPVALELLPTAGTPDTQHKSYQQDVQNAWDESTSKQKLDKVPLTENEKQAHRSSELHKEACEDVAEFIGSSSADEFSDEDYDSDYPQAADGGLVVASVQAAKTREDQAYDFFLDLFEKNEQLRKLYEEQCNAGKFQCLVCSSIAGKTIKNFNGLGSVVMHANTIQKTKRRAEHRGFGRAVCTLLGWEPDKIPALSVNKSICPRGCLPADDEETIAASVQEERITNGDSEDSKSSEGNSSDDSEDEQEDSEER